MASPTMLGMVISTAWINTSIIFYYVLLTGLLLLSRHYALKADAFLRHSLALLEYARLMRERAAALRANPSLIDNADWELTKPVYPTMD